MNAERKLEARKSIFPALAVSLLFVLMAGAGGRLLFDRYEDRAKAEATSRLASTGKLRAGQLSAFFRERKGDARVASDLLGTGLAEAWWQGGDKDLPAMVRRSLNLILAEYAYTGAMILDARGNIRFSAGRSVSLPAASKSLALQALDNGSPVFSIPYFAGPAAQLEVMLDTFAPIMSADGTKAVGVLILRGDWDHLLSLTLPWPEDGRSAEYLLVAKDGADVLFLNRAEDRKQAMNRLRMPLTGDAHSVAWPAINAVQGYYGAMESIDYRGEPVLSYSLPVPDSGWSMVAKEDVAEALEGLRHIETAATFSFLIVVALAFALWWWWLYSRQRAEQALRESNERFEKAFRASPDSITLVTLDNGTFVEVNAGFERFTGYSAAETMGRNARDLDLWMDPAQREYLFAELKAGRSVSGLEARIRRKDGETRVGQRFATRVAIGGVPHVLSIMRDITERKLVEEALVDSYRLLQAIVNTAPVRVFWKDRESRFLGCNPAFAKDAGEAHPNDLIGKDDYQLGWKAQAELYRADDRRVMDSGIPKLSYEEPQTTPDGHSIWLRTSKVPLRNANNETIGVLGIYEDITERKHADEEIRKLNAELEQRVQQRTSELQSANSELEKFAYSVAHDLRAPLRGIDGYSRLLLAEHAAGLDEDGRQFLRNIVRATQYMSELIDDLLAYSRLDRRNMQTAQIDPRALIEALLAERADEIRTRGVAVSVAVACPSVSTDRDGLAMALRNLLENALKFTRNVPKPTIEVSGHDTGTACILAVRDNGVGFDMKFHDKIFDIFQRLHRNEDYPGTGVGLAIVRKAMERMGGRAWAESAPGKGATFYLEIPE